MKWGIGAKLSLLLAGLVLLAAGVTGQYIFGVSQRLLVVSAANRLLTATQGVSLRLTSQRDDISRDLLLLTQHPATLAVLQGGGPAAADELATLFRLLMQGNTSYFQIRLIGVADHGLERVRVDRDGAQLHRVADDDLQEKGHYTYVQQTFKQPAGTTWMSRIAINHEVGIYSGQGKPSLQLAMPVVNAAGQAQGLVAINIDLQGGFAAMARVLPPGFELYLSNEAGDILIHPDPAKTFGFDRGRRMFIQDEFPALAPLVAGSTEHQVFETTVGPNGQAAVAGTFIRTPVKVAGEEKVLILGLTQPLNEVLSDARTLGQQVISLALFLGVGAVVLVALLLARWLISPLKAVHRATMRLDSVELDDAMPLQRHDEIGDLAHSIHQMKTQIREQIHTLQDNQEEFEYLAHHDTLTGLPNRRLLLDRLQLALARAQRHGENLALVFVDLDRFKAVNDDHGHDAGDVVLCGVAHCLKASVRAVDTVARLGGDEFVVLLDDPQRPANVEPILDKIRRLLAQGVDFQGKTLAVEASMGVSFYTAQAGGTSETAESLLNRADQEMYRSKAQAQARRAAQS